MDSITHQQHEYASCSGAVVVRDDIAQTILIADGQDINEYLDEGRRSKWIEASTTIMIEEDCTEEEADLVQAYRTYYG